MDEDENVKTDFERAQGCLVLLVVAVLFSATILCWAVIFNLAREM